MPVRHGPFGFFCSINSWGVIKALASETLETRKMFPSVGRLGVLPVGSTGPGTCEHRLISRVGPGQEG